TEAQWEKAARGPDGFKYPWGNGPWIWERPRAPGQIDKVASFRGDESPYGALDMAGNAREWCSDWYVEKYYSQLLAEGGSTARNPTGPRNSGGTNMRVVKGGDPNWLVWARSGVLQNEHPNDVGFRCVLRLKPAGKEPAVKEKKKAAK
ncbi:MAG TPA: SUMF1/EgtB/PvdO family nonheme iron enzyme, partial [Planctomycetaceae bacterium]